VSTGAVVALVTGTVLAGGLVLLYISQRNRIITQVAPKLLGDAVTEYGGLAVDALAGYATRAVRNYGVTLFSGSGKDDYGMPPPVRGLLVN
jgi:hypothetical protein